MPGVAKAILFAWVRTRLWITGDPDSADHWFALRLADELDYRLPIRARLGNGMTMRVAWNDYVSRNILTSGYYEPEIIRIFEKFLRPGMVLFDVGGHVGQYSLVGSRLVGDTGSVHSFEPDPRTFAWLKSNVEANRLTNVHVNQMALAGETGEKQFFFATPKDIGSNSLSKPSNFSGRTAIVRCMTIDDYMKEHGLTRVDMMKIDVEGAESFVLAGASSILNMAEKPLIVIEFEEARQKAFGNSCEKLATLLRARGYDLYRIGGAPFAEYTPLPNDAPSFNILAVPPEKAAQISDLLPARNGAKVMG
jgi:FkbM family methyltransferase